MTKADKIAADSADHLAADHLAADHLAADAVGTPAAEAVYPRNGLVVERVHSTEGVHPYAEVTWQRRDVVLTNWRDGSINFEQRGVEFPDFWSVNAANIVTTKYFRGAVGAETREWSLRQLIDRVVASYVRAGRAHGYFRAFADSEVFEHELTWMLLHQVFSFNSPVWFNVGTTSPQQVSACFILSVDDTMNSILNWYREEGLIFKGGSGAGLNLSRIRSSKELLSSGGTASGPVSFMRGADASAGTIKSGGATRRAAKMVVLDVDHPDIVEFVETKAREEGKIRVLRDAGFDMDLGGADITSVQYQNANNSVRVSDEFMRAAKDGAAFGLRARTTHEVLESVDAKELLRKIAKAAWECADPGIQYDDTINDWHTNPESGRITASNPCFPADQRVVTDKGLIRIGDLVTRAAAGEAFDVYTNDVTSESDPADRVVPTSPLRYMVTGTKEVLELRFDDGARLRCTPNHRVWTANRGWVRAEHLEPNDRVTRSFQHAPRTMADEQLPASAIRRARSTRGRDLPLTDKWDAELGHFLGWLIGAGRLTKSSTVTVYGSSTEQRHILPRHAALLERVTGRARTPSLQASSTMQLRATNPQLRELLAGLGVSMGRSCERVVPDAVFEAPEYVVSAFLRGLFDADGCVMDQPAQGTPYVGLASRSEELLLGVQEVLAGVGVRARISETGIRDGSAMSCRSDGPLFDLRVSGRHIALFSALIGFDHAGKAARLATLLGAYQFNDIDESARMTSRRTAGFHTTYNLTEPRNHSYVVSGVVVANCSEYMSLDNTSCNLASLNLMKFLAEDNTFATERFVKSVEMIITAMDISICFADFPTEAIAVNTRAYRQLGIGYANLGALLMASGLAYDSDGGRALAGAITSLMTATSYRRSAELAGIVGAYDGFARNAKAHARVMRKHAAANDSARAMHATDRGILSAATEEWANGNKIGEKNGWRNAQASVLAPTGCLVGETLVTTDRGLARLSELGDGYGTRWQDLGVQVATDDGPRTATKFFVNGEEPTRLIRTAAGYRIQGTFTHRIKVVEPRTGIWRWKRLADVTAGDLVPVQLGQLVGDPRRVPLPVLDQVHYAGDRHTVVPDSVDLSLAELVGYFMADGSLHAEGIRLCVPNTDLDAVERLRVLSKELFALEPVVTAQQGYQQVVLPSVRLARWWQAAGFAKMLPDLDHAGKGWTPRVPAAIRDTNDPHVYAAFLRGLFEADGSVLGNVPSVSTASETFADDIRSLLLVLGMSSTTRETVSGLGGPQFQVRLRNDKHAKSFAQRVGLVSSRNTALLDGTASQSGNCDRIILPDAVWLSIVPVRHELRSVVQQAVAHGRGISRDLATGVWLATGDTRVERALGYTYETVAQNVDGGVQPTYDLSVPSNVTYVAGGFVSHNTIGLMMDCDTTGVEPDLALVKFKKLVGGGSMQIVNHTVPRALRALGYQPEQIEAIIEFITEHGHVIDAPGLRQEHYEVFDCAMGARAIKAMGHVRMMAAAQPFLSGAISKTVNLPETATVEDIEDVYLQGWQLGLKALAVYRDNCKVGQPLSAGKGENKGAQAAVADKGVDKVVEYRPTRTRLPKSRPSRTTSFTVGGAEGYMTAGSYPDDGLGEVFLKLGKQGSTLAGVMDAFSIAISIALQYGVPLETYVQKFTNMRFDPAGLTDDPDIRMAQSILDYIFRRLALDYLDFDTRSALGIHTADERTRQLETGLYAPIGNSVEEDLETLAQSAPVTRSATDVVDDDDAAELPAPGGVHSSTELLESLLGGSADAPLCMNCGTKMRPAGSCFVCEGCGSTSGCS